MKRTAIAFAFLAVISAAPAQQEMPLPSGRTFIELRENERNPFGAQVSVVEPTVVEAAESEEARLRRIIRAMRVSGISGSEGDYRAMIGPLVLRAGDRFPPLLRGQFESIKVVSVDPKEIRLAFVERDPTIDARQIVIPFSLEPTVRQLLFGEAFEAMAEIGPDGGTNLPSLESKGVEEILAGTKESELQSLVERQINFLGEKSNETPPEPTE
ncbi:MAG: hypothetical protein SFU53_15805 [Terrimicrobiaceae bacterium]|nr:hypothetical protein [Terrimicrobiaceae bacterium]